MSNDLQVGMRVLHKKWGQGEVIPTDFVGNRSKMMVAFDDQRIVPKYIMFDGIKLCELEVIS